HDERARLLHVRFEAEPLPLRHFARAAAGRLAAPDADDRDLRARVLLARRLAAISEAHRRIVRRSMPRREIDIEGFAVADVEPGLPVAVRAHPELVRRLELTREAALREVLVRHLEGLAAAVGERRRHAHREGGGLILAGVVERLPGTARRHHAFRHVFEVLAQELAAAAPQAPRDPSRSVHARGTAARSARARGVATRSSAAHAASARSPVRPRGAAHHCPASDALAARPGRNRLTAAPRRRHSAGARGTAPRASAARARNGATGSAIWERSAAARARATGCGAAVSAAPRRLLCGVARRLGSLAGEGEEGNGSKNGETHGAVYGAAAFCRPATRERGAGASSRQRLSAGIRAVRSEERR